MYVELVKRNNVCVRTQLNTTATTSVFLIKP